MTSNCASRPAIGSVILTFEAIMPFLAWASPSSTHSPEDQSALKPPCRCFPRSSTLTRLCTCKTSYLCQLRLIPSVIQHAAHCEERIYKYQSSRATHPTHIHVGSMSRNLNAFQFDGCLDFLGGSRY